MLMSPVARQLGTIAYPDLAGARVLMTGLAAETDLALVRAFAEQRVRLSLQIAPQPRLEALIRRQTKAAAGLDLHTLSMAKPEAAIATAQRAACMMGGLDIVINLIRLTSPLPARNARRFQIENWVSDKLSRAALVTRVAANRMRVTWSKGLILNVLVPAPTEGRNAALLAGIVRSALATMTRIEARDWAQAGIRINAIAPPALEDLDLCEEMEVPDTPALALYLASDDGRRHSGHVFQAA